MIRDNIGWILIGGATAVAIYSSAYNFILFAKIESLNKQLISIEFDQDVCIRRVQELTSHERELKK